jgi:signal transduction histidine kinase
MTAILLLFLIKGTAQTPKLDSLQQVLVNQQGKDRILTITKIGTEYQRLYPDTALHYSDLALGLIEKNNEPALYTYAYLVKGHAYREKRDFPQSKKYFNKAIITGDKYNKVEQTGLAYGNLGVVFQITVQYDSAIICFNKAIEHYLKINLEKRLGRTYDNLGIVYFLKGNYNMALENFLQALKYFQKTNDTRSQSSSLYKISSIYSNLENYPEATKYALRAYEELKNVGEKIEIVRALNNLGIIYRNQKMYEKALEYYLKAFEVIKDQPVSNTHASLLGNIGVVYNNLNDSEKSLENHQRALGIALSIGDKNLMATGYNNIAEVQFKQNEYDSAERNFMKSVELFEEMKQKSNIIKPYQRLYEINKIQNRYSSALSYFERHSELKDSLMQSQRVKSLDSMLTIFNTRELENDNIILAQETELKSKTIVNQRLYLGLAIVLILFVASMAAIVLRNQKKLKAAYNIVNKKNEEILEFSEELRSTNERLIELDNFKSSLMHMIVHDLKNPLNALINAPLISEGKQLKDLVQHISHNMLTLVLNILDIDKYEENQFVLNRTAFKLKDKVDKNIDLLRLLYEQKSLTVILEDSTTCLVYADADIFERVLTNLLTNAIKFSPNGSNIRLTAKQEPGFVKICVIDVGPGIAPEYHSLIFEKYVQLEAKNMGIARSTGLGLPFCKIAVEAHGGQIGVVSDLGNGSTFWVTFPIELSMNDEKNHSDESSSNAIENNLTPNEVAIIRKCALSLDGIKLFELSRIKEEVGRLNASESKNVNQWARQILQAVFSNNEEEYYKLIDEAKRN